MSSAPTGPEAAAAAPRLCCLEKGPDGYGFHLHGEKGKPGQFIRLVEAGSPAERSGLLAGDRLLEVDGANVERESHQQVVERIRAAAGSVRLLVVQPQQPQQPEEPPHKPLSPPDGGEAQRDPPTAEPAVQERSGGGSERELRPRLCHITKGPNGYGFNLHSDKSRPGQYIRAVDPGSPAEAAGLRPQDRIVEVGDGAGGCLGSPKLGMGLPETRGVTDGAAQRGGARELPFWGTVTQGRAVATQGRSRALIHPLGDKLQSPRLSPRGARLSLGCPRVG
uniref:SLC9A3 regulator 1 n=1 Tax=Cairina moschata TaxID=8855 RepID=A0A8C3CGJ1_CAIMO